MKHEAPKESPKHYLDTVEATGILPGWQQGHDARVQAIINCNKSKILSSKQGSQEKHGS